MPSSAALLADGAFRPACDGPGRSPVDRSHRDPARPGRFAAKGAPQRRSYAILGIRSAPEDLYPTGHPCRWGDRAYRFQRRGFPGKSSPTFDYHQPTDILYIKLRSGESVDNEVLADSNIVIDVAADGTALGYEIQHASSKRDLIAAVILGEGHAAVAAA